MTRPVIDTRLHRKQTGSSDSHQGKKTPAEIFGRSEMWVKTLQPECSWYYKTQFHNLSCLIFHISRLTWPPPNLLFEKYSFKWQHNQQVSGAHNKDAIFFTSVTYLTLNTARPSINAREISVSGGSWPFVTYIRLESKRLYSLIHLLNWTCQ